MQLLQHSWQRAWSALNAAPAPGLFERLVDSYSEPHRCYHTLQHLSECIQGLQPALGLAEHAGEVEVALWFHDAIYELKRHDNEQQSAFWAQRELVAAGLEAPACERVYQLVMATQHAALPTSPDERLLVDIDLSILGAAPARFAEYEAQVRAEYAWVPGWLFRRKRKAILRAFLDRQAIYATEHFRLRYEAQARQNLVLSSSANRCG
jgi:predicted metal-dependent HD superfamily phosphohydrolase